MIDNKNNRIPLIIVISHFKYFFSNIFVLSKTILLQKNGLENERSHKKLERLIILYQ